HLAQEEWGALQAVPKIRQLVEPQGRLRWLTPEEEARLLAACRASRTPELVAVVIVALETGMRAGEIYGLTWERVDFSRGVIQLEITKRGTRREIPMRQMWTPSSRRCRPPRPAGAASGATPTSARPSRLRSGGPSSWTSAFTTAATISRPGS
ncbi:MAG TPA: site-specific integrase, partial [Methylomirabilota bacterium]|nr:site-specific integrase [Methylomirabilota bacterium]